MTMGLYEVVGRRRYRDHAPGETFEARLDRNAERRAVTRGDIRLIRIVQPDLQPGSFTFPDGWLSADHSTNHRGADEASLSLRRE